MQGKRLFLNKSLICKRIFGSSFLCLFLTLERMTNCWNGFCLVNPYFMHPSPSNECVSKILNASGLYHRLNKQKLQIIFEIAIWIVISFIIVIQVSSFLEQLKLLTILNITISVPLWKIYKVLSPRIFFSSFIIFIRYLLERDFPGMRIGPEPTTDNFHVIEYSEEDGKIPGEFKTRTTM